MELNKVQKAVVLVGLILIVISSFQYLGISNFGNLPGRHIDYIPFFIRLIVIIVAVIAGIIIGKDISLNKSDSIYQRCRHAISKRSNQIAIVVLILAVIGGVVGIRLYNRKDVFSKENKSPTDNEVIELVMAANPAELLLLPQDKIDAYRNLRLDGILKESMRRKKGVFDIIGWRVKGISEGTYLVSYTYRENNDTIGWIYEVKPSIGKVRSVLADSVLFDFYKARIKEAFGISY